ncbi:MAG: hypothetical protein AAGK05_13195, partial [Pseudomonadota bacterium]
MNKYYIKLFALSSYLLSCTVAAEDDFTPIKPLDVEKDINSVNLLDGKYYPTLPTLSIPAAPRLTLEFYFCNVSKVILG